MNELLWAIHYFLPGVFTETFKHSLKNIREYYLTVLVMYIEDILTIFDTSIKNVEHSDQFK